MGVTSASRLLPGGAEFSTTSGRRLWGAIAAAGHHPAARSSGVGRGDGRPPRTGASLR